MTISKVPWYRQGILLGAFSVLALLVVGSGAAAPSSALARPSISSFTPRSGPVGTEVAIRGTNLLGGSVAFNGVPTSVNVTYSGDDSNDYELTATVPNGATSGSITITTNGGVAKTSAQFQVTPGSVTGLKGKPTVSGFEPTKAKPGVMITVSGREPRLSLVHQDRRCEGEVLQASFGHPSRRSDSDGREDRQDRHCNPARRNDEQQ